MAVIDKTIKHSILDEYDDDRNLVEDLDFNDLKVIHSELVQFYQKDKSDCYKRHESMKKYLGIVDNDEKYRRTSRLPNGADNHYSLMTDAVNEFQTTFINEFPFDEPVKALPRERNKSQQDIALELFTQGVTSGGDPTKAGQLVQQEMQKHRASNHALMMQSRDAVLLLNYQLTEDMPNWCEDTQGLAKLLACQGTVIRKYSFCPIEQKPLHKTIEATDFVVDKDARTIEGAKRLSECFNFSYSDIKSFIQSEYFVQYDNDMHEIDPNDDDARFEIVEMCVRLDLDGDDYPEPYIVWFDKVRSHILRIQKNFKRILRSDKGKAISIMANMRYCRYSFLPNPKSFFGIGLCDILEQSQNALSSMTNLMIDAGAKSVLGGGFIATDVKSGSLRYSPGEYKPIATTGQSLRDGIFDMPVPQPNNTLFAVMQLLDAKASSLANLNQFNTENFTANTAPTTAMIMFDQSTKKLRAILRRVFLAFRKEIEHLVEANKRYLNIERYNFLMQKQFQDGMFDNEAIEFMPNKDIEDIGNVGNMAKVQFLGGMLQDPYTNPKRARQVMFEQMGFNDADYFIQDPPPPPPQEPDPVMMGQLQIAQKQLELQAQKQQSDFSEKMQKLQLEAQKQQDLNEQFRAKLQQEIEKMFKDYEIRKEQNQIDMSRTDNENLESKAIAMNHMAQVAERNVNAVKLAKEVDNDNRDDITNQQ